MKAPRAAVAPDPADLELLRDGAMSVRQAVEFAGVNRSYLFELMAGGVLEWFHFGTDRRIVRSSLIRYLASLYAAENRDRAKSR